MRCKRLSDLISFVLAAAYRTDKLEDMREALASALGREGQL